MDHDLWVATPDSVQLTDLFLDGVYQMDVVLRHQRDGDAIPPWKGPAPINHVYLSLQTTAEDSA